MVARGASSLGRAGPALDRGRLRGGAAAGASPSSGWRPIQIGWSQLALDHPSGALSVILGRPRLRGSPLLRRLLKFVVEEGLREGGESPSATTNARAALGKGPDFRRGA